MNIGIIGTGNMGTILAEAFVEGKAISPSSIILTNRTKTKALALQNKYPEMTIGSNAAEVAAQCDLIFICVKPMDVYKILDEAAPYLSDEKCVISITSPINTKQIEQKVTCSVARVIPSITNRALAGVSLLSYGEHCRDSWKEEIEKLMGKVSIPVQIDEKFTRVASDIVSCGPAFFAYLLRRFISAAVSETEIDEKTATLLASEMVVGLGELLRQGHYTLPSLQQKVCVKGGITGEGINVLENGLGDLFEQLYQATHEKFKEDLEKVDCLFSPQ